MQNKTRRNFTECKKVTDFYCTFKKMLTLQDLESSSSNENLKSVLEANDNIQALKKERQQLNQRIQSLENDIECARRAKEVADASALNLLRRLQEIMKATFNTDQIVDKIVELQEKSKKYKDEVDDITVQINLKEEQKQNDLLSSKIEIDSCNSKISQIIEEQRDIQQKIDQLRAETETMNNNTGILKSTYEQILEKKQKYPKLNIYPTQDILNWIEENSDSNFMKFCAKYAKLLNIEFNNDVNSFGDKIEARFFDMESNINQFENQFKNLSDKTHRILELKAAKSNRYKEIKQLLADKRKQTDIEIKSANDLDDALRIHKKYKKSKSKRMKLLTDSLNKACIIADMKQEIGESYFDICNSYIEIAKDMKHNIHELAFNPQKLNLTNILYKVDSVKQQNNLLIRRLNPVPNAN